LLRDDMRAHDIGQLRVRTFSKQIKIVLVQ